VADIHGCSWDQMGDGQANNIWKHGKYREQRPGSYLVSCSRRMMYQTGTGPLRRS
jgi:hypothetical protein